MKDQHTAEPLIGATALIDGTNSGAISNQDGMLTLRNISSGSHSIVFSYIGYESKKIVFDFPLNIVQPFQVFLESGQELETVYVTAMRSGRTIDDIPTRTEVIGPEELTEKGVMNSMNIAMLLRESTGIMMQQTSANSGNQSLRIQGLDGRYTQLLKDGFPLFGGFSGGLSIMQVPPLDLAQVEVIKGSSSTLYGGGAIAGIVNLVTKEPKMISPELSLMLNQTSANGTTANVFLSKRSGRTGFSLYTSANRLTPYDANDDEFSDIPKVRGLSINPKFFWYPTDQSKLWIGLNSSFEDRIGGDIEVLDGNANAEHIFSEENLSKRMSSRIHFEHQNEKGLFNIRNSVNYFDREIRLPGYSFGGRQIASFTELSWFKENKNQEWIAGINLFSDSFKEDKASFATVPRDYSYLTLGTFVQSNWTISEKFDLESGFRLDYNTSQGIFPLPRINLLYKPGNNFTMRVGGGMGYKLQTIFNEEAEMLSFRDIAPIDMNTLDPERSVGANFDLNYKTVIAEKLGFTINQLFYFTRLTNSLVLESGPGNNGFAFANAEGPIKSRGIETNIKLTFYDFKLFLQYAYNDVDLTSQSGQLQKPLTPKHNAGAVLVFEKEHKWRIGYELYYTGRQYRSDYTNTRDYWIMGLMMLRSFEHIKLFINFENFTDTRQSKYQSMVIPPYSDPSFTEIWAPTEGFVTNAGVIFNLW